jgi:competence protein ComEC
VPAPVVGAIGAVLAAAGYSAMAGFVVPTQRALIMLAVAMAALIWRRRLAPTQVLATALLLVLVHDPLAVMASGFWLSFAAVGVIFLVAGYDRTRFRGWRKWSHLQWAITIGMLPLGLFLFRQVSLVAPVANMLAVPVFDLLAVPLTLAGIVTLPLFPDTVADWCFQAAALVLQGLWPALDWLAAGEGVMWSQPPPPLWSLGCAVTGVALLLAPRGFPARWVGAVWMLPMLLVRPPGPPPGQMWFTQLDVGQGSAAVVRTAEHTLVFDTGPSFGPTFDTGEAVVVPYLRETGAGAVDVLMVSHGGSDHLGGAASLRRDWRVQRVVTSVPDRFEGAEACVGGMGWEWDGVEFAVLAPPAGQQGEANDASCVLQVRAGDSRVLLTGDIEAARERRLLAEYGAELGSDVLQVPHHGSRTSSTSAWVETVRPRYALFSVGYRNRFRHPHPTVTARYRKVGAMPLETPDTGAVEFRSAPDGWTWSSYRAVARRYWFAPVRGATDGSAPAQP